MRLGTSLYNEKKKDSQKIIEKKETKVKEMNELLTNDIEPQMDKLRKVIFITKSLNSRKENSSFSGNQAKSSSKSSPDISEPTTTMSKESSMTPVVLIWPT